MSTLVDPCSSNDRLLRHRDPEVGAGGEEGTKPRVGRKGWVGRENTPRSHEEREESSDPTLPSRLDHLCPLVDVFVASFTLSRTRTPSQFED